MSLQDIKIHLPSNWKEASRMGNERQVVLRVYHINPITKINQEDRQDHPLDSNNPLKTVSRISPETAGPNPLTDFYKGMKGAIESGFMPPEMTMEKLDTMWKGMTATPHAETPADSDLAGDIGIVEFDTPEMAYQQLKNMTMGWGAQDDSSSMLIGGGIPGFSKDTKIEDYDKNELFKKMMTREQFEGLIKIGKLTVEAQPKLQEDIKKSGVKYIEKEYLGCKAIFSEMPNPKPKPSKAPSKPVKNEKEGMGGSRGNDITAAMPQIPKEDDYKPILSNCSGMVFGRFLIAGSILSSIGLMPSGDKPCQSLTGTKKVESKMREGDTVFTDVALVPTLSNIKQEGYYHKEEAEEIFEGIIKTLK